MGPALLLWMTLATPAPERALFLFEMADRPVGWVRLTWAATEARFTYRSVHLFARGGEPTSASSEVTLAVDARGKVPTGERPEALWLWRRPPLGCVAGLDELTRARGPLCADASTGDLVRGSVQGRPFEARYDEGGRLLSLSLPSARFTRTEGPPPTLAETEDPFAEGFPVAGEGGPLSLERADASHLERAQVRCSPSPRRAWTAGAARRLSAAVHRSFHAQRPSSADLDEAKEPGATVGSCRAHAWRLVRLARARGECAELVQGLVVDGARAFPHAWVVVETDSGSLQLDPTSLVEVSAATHLALAPVGEHYLALLSGQVKVTRAAR